MSKVAVKGNASGTGTFTIEAPNSNTDRTLTLPDEAGTVLTSATAIPQAQIASALNATGSAPIYACRAWVNFNGTNGSIRASGNVSSVTRNGTGQYTVNYATAMPDNAYCTHYSCTSNDDVNFTAGGGRQFAMVRLGNTTSVRVQCIDDGGGLSDSLTNHVAIFR